MMDILFLLQLDFIGQMHGIYMICTETYGNGQDLHTCLIHMMKTMVEMILIMKTVREW